MDHTVELTRNVYGFRDPDVLAPANFVTTDDVLRAIVFNGRMVATILEVKVSGDYTKARRRLLSQVKKLIGFSCPITKETASFGGAFSR